MVRNLGSSDRKSAIWQRHLDGWRRSGLSQRSYCDNHGLSLSTFQVWRRRLSAGGDENPRECVELVPVPRGCRTSQPIGDHPASVVLCVREYRIEIGEGVTAETLRRVLDIVEAR